MKKLLLSLAVVAMIAAVGCGNEAAKLKAKQDSITKDSLAKDSASKAEAAAAVIAKAKTDSVAKADSIAKAEEAAKKGGKKGKK